MFEVLDNVRVPFFVGEPWLSFNHRDVSVQNRIKGGTELGSRYWAGMRADGGKMLTSP
jgi:hypothetical protein